MMIRRETAADAPAVAEVVRAAFGAHGDEVMLLVDALRAAAEGDSPGHQGGSVDGVPRDGGRPWYRGLIAVDGDSVVGHVGMSPEWVVTEDRRRVGVCCLAPLSVTPSAQRAGVGRALAAALVEEASTMGFPAVVLEGDPAVYSRYGFAPASARGLRRVSPLIPEPAQQMWALTDDLPEGRLMYPEPVWRTAGSGLPVEPWLDEFDRQAGLIAALTLDAAAPMPGIPGWDADALLDHLGTVYRLVARWLRDGARPRLAPVRGAVAPGMDAWHWMVDAWHDLHEVLAERDADAPASTWCSYDTTVGFWRRRMAHETAIHALDAVVGAGLDAASWWVPDEVASDGVAEALKLWLGTMSGPVVGGVGQRVAVAPDGEEPWITALHAGVVEVHRLGGDVDARVSGSASALYRWLWGRAADDEVRIEGDVSAVRALRTTLARAMQ